jgi:hypothetical protein
MNLAELAFACYIYTRMTDYDSSYCRFLDKVSPQLDLKQEQHRMELLKWLNDWGCRQFALQYHPLASREIGDWYQQYGQEMFPTDRTLLSLTDNEFAQVQAAYSHLVGRTASIRKIKGEGETQIQIGPTGAAKILFALRPKALIPWDDPIRDELNLDDSARSYCVYLSVAQEYLQELNCDCGKLGFDLNDLPRMLGRPNSTVAKLIDEYAWVTISRKFPMPSKDEFIHWVDWS